MALAVRNKVNSFVYLRFYQCATTGKKETALRKKYKNELEDLKGAIRVYARCRPMVSYEREKGCKQVVDFVDESRLHVKHR